MENDTFIPETCPMEELEKRIDSLELDEEFHDTMQLAAKRFINSTYGYFGTSFATLANTDIAESITLQGQDLIKYSVVKINDYIKNHWNSDVEGHNRIADSMREIFGDKFDYDRFLECARTNKIQLDTVQVYGDSVVGDSVVLLANGVEKRIEDLFNEVCSSDSMDKVRVKSNRKILCVRNNQCTGVVERPISYIMRHHTNKHIWRISCGDNHVECTSDHSVIVYRNNKLTPVSAEEIKVDDYLKVYHNHDSFNSNGLKHVDSVEDLGPYNGFVYDIAVETGYKEDCHNFFANNILVHNTDSTYVTLQPIIDACYIPTEQQLDFDLTFYNEVLSGYMDGMFDEYAKDFNCNQNLEKFELEKISRTIILLAKKNYMCDVEWIETGARFDPLEHITYTGFDVVKGVISDYCRDELKNFVNYVMGILNTGRKPTLSEIVSKLKEIKKRFIMQNPNEISFTKGISNYTNFVKNDKTPEIEYFLFKKEKQLTADGKEIEVQTNNKLPVPIHVRAAAVYNNMLFNKASKYRSKYSLLKSGEKVRFYYTGEDSVFGFVPDLFPLEFAPPVDIDIQFEKVLLSPMNRIVSAIGYPEIPPTLTYTPSLF